MLEEKNQPDWKAGVIAAGLLALSSCSGPTYKVGIVDGRATCIEKYCVETETKCYKGECGESCKYYSYRVVDDELCNRW